MKTKLAWLASAALVAAFGGWACDSGNGGGGSSKDICDETLPDYDEDACIDCLREKSRCATTGACGEANRAVVQCAEDHGCMVADPDTSGRCVAQWCMQHYQAATSCMQTRCPEASGCTSF